MSKIKYRTSAEKKERPSFTISPQLSGVQLLSTLVHYDVERLFPPNIVLNRIKYDDVRSVLAEEPESFKEIIAQGRTYGFPIPSEFTYTDLRVEDMATSQVSIGLALFYKNFPMSYHYSMSGWIWNPSTYQSSKDLALLAYESMDQLQRKNFTRMLFSPFMDKRGLSEKEIEGLPGLTTFLPNLGIDSYLAVQLINTVIRGNDKGKAYATTFMNDYFAKGIPAQSAIGFIGALSDAESELVVKFLKVHYDKTLIDPIFEKFTKLDLSNSEHLQRYSNFLILLEEYSRFHEELKDPYAYAKDIAPKVWTTYVKIEDPDVAAMMHPIFDLIPLEILDFYYNKESKIKKGPNSKMRLNELANKDKGKENNRYLKYAID
ncbi:MAG: hypothetical protein ABIJ34_03620 [archaeon]